MTSNRDTLTRLIEQGSISEDDISEALRISKLSPDGIAWITFLSKLMLWLGGLSIALAGLFFIAYNWNELGRFSKFAMVEVTIVLTTIGYLKLAKYTVAAEIVLMMNVIFIGVLFALFGQTYQTGADPWQLFFNWALVITPFVIIGRSTVLIVFWLALINLTLMLHLQLRHSMFGYLFQTDASLLWSSFGLNISALILWEYFNRHFEWLNKRWAIRLLATVSGVAISWLCIFNIFEDGNNYVWGVPIWLLWMAAIYYYYRRIQIDLFMISGYCLSGIVIVTSAQIKLTFQDFLSINFLMVAITIIGLSTASSVWLRKIHREEQS